jgi:predicted molibdopterin-dependent oxidoreductase YjgC
LPLYNNSVGAHDIGLMSGAPDNAREIIDAAGKGIRALYIAGSFLEQDLQGRAEKLDQLDFIVVQELFQTETTKHADVVLPAASFAEVDGTYTNNDGFVQRARQSIEPFNQAKADWIITSLIARELGHNFGYQMAATAIFKELADSLTAYNGLRYPALKDESKPVQAKHAIHDKLDLSKEIAALKSSVEALQDNVEKINEEPKVGHELFKLGTLTSKTEQFQLLAAGNPKPEDVYVSPLYQIESLQREEVVVAGD